MLDLRSIFNTVQGGLEKLDKQGQLGWMQSRFIAGTMSKEAGQHRFAWEVDEDAKKAKPTFEEILDIKKRYGSYLNSRQRSS